MKKIYFIYVIVGLALFVFFLGAKNLSKNKIIQNIETISNSTINNQQIVGFEQKITLSTKNNNDGGLFVDVTPIDFSFGKPVQFKIVLTTHRGDLNFDLTQRSVLADNLGNIYLPLEWQGSRGGHHLSGILVFPTPKDGIKQLKLIIKNIYEVDERIFEWNLK